jgi:N-acetylglutamate synthase-like GNAT family acetyltransferase
MESSTLPPGYSVRRATEQDNRIKNNSFWSFMIRFIFGLLLVTFLFNTLFDYNWQRAQLAVEFETGRRSQFFTFEDWCKIGWLSLEQVVPVLVPMFGIGHLISRFVTSLIRPDEEKQERWVAVYKSQIIGRATVRLEQNYSILMLVSINPGHWWQGVGSNLVWNSIKDAKKPLYLTCLPRLQPFYSRFGFVAVTERSIPPDFRRHNLGCVMALFDAPILPQERDKAVFPLPDGCSIYSIQNITERLQVYKRFWSRKSFKQSRVYVFIFIGIIFATEISVLAILWKITEIWGTNWLAIIISLVTILAPVLTILIWWQEWIIEQGIDVIAYTHISCRREYSVLYCLHVEPEFQQKNLGQAFLERLTRRIQLPIYLVCPQQKVQFYTHLGFAPTSQQNLPFELQIFRLGNYVALKKTS